MNNEDTDITIGPGKLLGLFFMLVAICGVFFAIGYSLGKTSAKEQALNDKTQLNASLNAPVVGDSSAAKPSAGVSAKSNADDKGSQSAGNEPSSPDLTFFNAVKRDDRNGQDGNAGKNEKQQKPDVASGKSEPMAAANTAVAPAPGTKLEVASTAGGEFVVQIAAVTREEDAAALAGALRKKSYSVFVVNNPSTHDKFYHVQVGPFSTLQDAETMKAKLTGEGYNPIVKRS